MICNLILARSPTATQCSFHVTGAVKCAESKFQQMCSLFDSYFYCFYREWNFNKKSMLKPGWQQERKIIEAMPWWKGREHIGRVGKRLVFCFGNSCEIRVLLLCTQDCLLAVKKTLRGKRLVWQFCQAILAVQSWGEGFSLCHCSYSRVSRHWAPMWLVCCYGWEVALSSQSRTDWCR